MTLGTGDFVAKLKRNWSTKEEYGQLIKPHELVAGEMSHVWEVKNLQYMEGGKKLIVEMEEVE